MKDKKLEEYLEETSKAEILSIDEELKLVKTVQAKGTDCDEMKRLEKADGRFVASIAKQYKDQGLTDMELIEAGIEGLRRAVMKFDLKSDYKFIAYAVWWIRQAMIQAIAEKK